MSPAVFLLQAAAFLGHSSPPSGDTTGYWQQRVAYTITATLDETREAVRARGELIYVNNSPDTLREMYFHQHLNAFRPGSRWSAVDEREGRVRFQQLVEPNYGYERLLAAPTVDGAAVQVIYPGAPDSTVFRFALPRPLGPGDSARVRFEWEARPSTVPRRQGRSGRHYDVAQWYPRVAVYDRGGWQPNALVPAGEFYGEFGTYDVTLVVRDDQVLGATGVPVSGDPGWERVLRAGVVHLNRDAYANVPPGPSVDVPPGMRAVRWYARDVHHFAWTASPDYRYEGGVHVRASPARAPFRTWDSVGVHVLYKPRDDTTWAGGRVLQRTFNALNWIERTVGPYAYPQVSVTRRLDGGGTEFPMLMMNGSHSQGIILHELAHIYFHGVLANNEWRAGWMDEGMASYLSRWAQDLTPQERAAAGVVREPPLLAEGYRVNAATIPRSDSTWLPLWRMEVDGRSQPPATPSHEFSEFAVYQRMTYDRAEVMFGHLRDLMGDDTFRAFLQDFYHRWAFKHVDERAMRASAARVHGVSLDWFFDQWLHRTGLLDYSLDAATSAQVEPGRWVTRATITQRAGYAHPMPVGVRTASGWTIGRGSPHQLTQVVEIATTQEPTDVRIDPHGVTWDWDHRNNTLGVLILGVARMAEPLPVFDWPALDQSDRFRTVVALSPQVWYSSPQGVMLGARARGSYLTHVDRYLLQAGFATRTPDGRIGPNVLQLRLAAENPVLPWADRPLMGYAGAVAFLDGILKMDASYTRDLSALYIARGPQLATQTYATIARPTGHVRLLPEQWSDESVAEAGIGAGYRSGTQADGGWYQARASAGVGFASPRTTTTGLRSRAYGRVEGELTSVRYVASGSAPVAPGAGARRLDLRLYGALAPDAPTHRAVFASSANPFETFTEDWYRPRGALLKGTGYTPYGGAMLRGFSSRMAFDRVVAANGEIGQRLVERTGSWGRGSLWVGAFLDVGLANTLGPVLPDPLLVDAGPSLVVRGRFFDRNVELRADAPVVGSAGWDGVGVRWGIRATR